MLSLTINVIIHFIEILVFFFISFYIYVTINLRVIFMLHFLFTYLAAEMKHFFIIYSISSDFGYNVQGFSSSKRISDCLFGKL